MYGNSNWLWLLFYLDFSAEVPLGPLVPVPGKLFLAIFSGGVAAYNDWTFKGRLDEVHMAITKCLS